MTLAAVLTYVKTQLAQQLSGQFPNVAAYIGPLTIGTPAAPEVYLWRWQTEETPQTIGGNVSRVHRLSLRIRFPNSAQSGSNDVAFPQFIDQIKAILHGLMPAGQVGGIPLVDAATGQASTITHIGKEFTDEGTFPRLSNLAENAGLFFVDFMTIVVREKQ